MKLVVWDVDGTLVDSRQSIFRTAEAVYGELGLRIPTYDEVRQIVGLGLREAFVVLSPELDATGIDRLTDTYRQLFQKLRRDGSVVEPLYEGAAETLDRLRAEGWKIAMATGKRISPATWSKRASVYSIDMVKRAVGFPNLGRSRLPFLSSGTRCGARLQACPHSRARLEACPTASP